MFYESHCRGGFYGDNLNIGVITLFTLVDKNAEDSSSRNCRPRDRYKLLTLKDNTHKKESQIWFRSTGAGQFVQLTGLSPFNCKAQFLSLTESLALCNCVIFTFLRRVGDTEMKHSRNVYVYVIFQHTDTLYDYPCHSIHSIRLHTFCDNREIVAVFHRNCHANQAIKSFWMRKKTHSKFVKTKEIIVSGKAHRKQDVYWIEPVTLWIPLSLLCNRS